MSCPCLLLFVLLLSNAAAHDKINLNIEAADSTNEPSLHPTGEPQRIHSTAPSTVSVDPPVPTHSSLVPLAPLLPPVGTQSHAFGETIHRRLSTDWCSSQSPVGVHTLLRGQTCTFSFPLTVAPGTSLNLSSDSGNDLPAAVISGGGAIRLFVVTNSDVTITDLILERGTADGGGAFFISEAAHVHLIRTVVQLCDVSLYGGGAYVANGGTLVLHGSTFQSNTAAKFGGGIFANIGSSVVVVSGHPQSSSALLNNVAHEFGGGIYLSGQGTRLDVHGNNTQLLIQSNTATKRGGGVQNVHVYYV